MTWDLNADWLVIHGVTCVAAPCCAFTFDADHTDLPDGGYSCPACEVIALEAEVAALRDVLVFADGRSVSRGARLADLYAADSEKQGVLARAGCHPRTAPSGDTDVQS